MAYAARGLLGFIKINYMNELIEQVVQKTGIPADKAKQVLEAISSFVGQKFPHLSGPLQSVLGGSGSAAGGEATQEGNNPLGDIGGKFGF